MVVLTLNGGRERAGVPNERAATKLCSKFEMCQKPPRARWAIFSRDVMAPYLLHFDMSDL